MANTNPQYGYALQTFREKGIEELQRHAGVSIDNRHSCGTCFTCACVKLAKQLSKPVRELACACCGGYTRGRQWFNQDTGYGICNGCIAFMRKRGETEAEIRSNYGDQGVHWGICK